MKRSIALMLALLGACDAYELVGPEPGVPPRAHISVVVDTDERPRYAAYVYVLPGTDERARPRTAIDSAAVVDGQRLKPSIVVTPEGGQWTFEWHDSLSGATRSTLDIRIPDFDGHSNAARQLSIPVHSRHGARIIEIRENENVPLYLAKTSLDIPGLEVQGVNWLLQLEERCDGARLPLFVVQGPTAYPARMVAPFAWIEATGRDSLQACVRLHQYYTARSFPYVESARISTRAVWEIRVRRP
jgi:hypothetical protein